MNLLLTKIWKNAKLSSVILYFCEVLKNIAMEKCCTVEKVSEILEKLPENGILKEITDPVEWQRQLRDEWETDFERF